MHGRWVWVVISGLLFGCNQGESDKEKIAKLQEEVINAQAKALSANADLQQLKEQGGTIASASVPPSDSRPAAAAGATKLSAPVPGVYSLDVVTQIATDCRNPSVMLVGVPHAVLEKEDFAWSHALQALYAHADFDLVARPALKAKNQVALEQTKVNAAATGLVAHCFDGATCSELAAMYRTTVPSSRPEVYCGKKWETGTTPADFKSRAALEAQAKKKLKDEPSSMCARVGICKKQRNPALEGDPGQDCQKKPSAAKYKCSQHATCEEVVKCTEG